LNVVLETEIEAMRWMRIHRRPFAAIGKVYGVSANTVRALLDSRVRRREAERISEPGARAKRLAAGKKYRSAPDFYYRQKLRACGVGI
jgi:hypothetical protein